MQQLELVRRENPGQHMTQELPAKLEDEALRALVALMADAILAVVRQPEVDDER